MKTNIKSLWKGMIPVRDKYARVALMKQEDLVVHCEDEDKNYVIPLGMLKTPHSIKKVPDNFSDEMQELLYYRLTSVKEEVPQTKLL